MASISIVSVSVITVKVFILTEDIQQQLALPIPQIPFDHQTAPVKSILQSLFENNGLVVLVVLVVLAYSALADDKLRVAFRDLVQKVFLFGEEEEEDIELESKVQELEGPLTIPSYKEFDKLPSQFDSKLKLSVPLDDGVNGVYFMKDINEDILAVFKPQDEEAFAPNNRKNRVGTFSSDSPLKNGVQVGDSCLKEVAAYLVDHENYAGVPATDVKVLSVREGEDAKFGSLQAYVKNDGCAEDFSSNLFDSHDAHAIGLLDARIMNLDRHSGNILVQKKDDKLKLTPIDHGYSLPDFRNLKDAYFEWTNWKQSSEPFSQEEKEYVKRIDILRDVNLLAKLGIRDESIMTYILANIFVKYAVENGWNMKKIGEFMQRDALNDESPSGFERLVYESIPDSFDVPSFSDPNLWKNPSVVKFFETFASKLQILHL